MIQLCSFGVGFIATTAYNHFSAGQVWLGLLNAALALPLCFAIAREVVE